MAVVLHQFNFSHFNDKARWALSYKGVEYTRETYLPGPHMPAIRKLSGQTSTPVLDWHGKVIAGSAAIIAHLELAAPSPALIPADERLAQQALALQARFDKEVGPATRTVLFAALAEEAGYMTSMFGAGKNALKRLGYRTVFPLAKGMIKRGNNVTPESIAARKDVTQKALNEVARATEDTGYLVGDSFSVADLTAACFFAPLANPSHPDMARPEPIPGSVEAVLATYREHPAIAWTNRMYELHRA